MTPDQRRVIASKGGKSVPKEERFFAVNPELATKAGKQGGNSVPADKRAFAKDKDLAARAGTKGGKISGRINKPE